MKGYLIIGIFVIVTILIYYLGAEKLKQKVKSVMAEIITPPTLRPILAKMILDAAKVGVALSYSSAERSDAEQMFLRRQNVIDKTKVNDIHYLRTAPKEAFKPVTEIPGVSHHMKNPAKGRPEATAVDFNVTHFPASFNWLVNNAHKYGFIATTVTEPWHWDYQPGVDKFAWIKQGNAFWNPKTA